MPTVLRAEPLDGPVATLGEGPQWDASRGLLRWVDIAEGLVHVADEAGDLLRTFTTGQQVGAALPALGGYLIADEDALTGLDDESGSQVCLLPLLRDQPGMRFNDARCDPAGRAWVGSVSHELVEGRGRLHRIDDGPTATSVISGLTVPNGMGWDPDGEMMWFADSARPFLAGYAYDVATGSLGEQRRRVQTQLAKDLEPYHLFFLEDVVASEDNDYLLMFRAQTRTPIAMGELYTNVRDYLPAVSGRLIDFIRVHLSDIEGLTPARKLAALCELFGVRTAWHGPGDTSPIGHAANLALDIATANFGIQETPILSERLQEVFPGCPDIRDGTMWPSDRPGLGVDVDVELAARFPFAEHPYNGAWPEIRRLDGTVVRP